MQIPDASSSHRALHCSNSHSCLQVWFAFLLNTWNLDLDSLQSSSGKLRNILPSPLLEAWGWLWAQPELTLSAPHSLAAHTCSSCCSSGEHASFAWAGKERQRREDKRQAGTGSCGGTPLSQQSYRTFFFLLLLCWLTKACWSNFPSTQWLTGKLF